MDLFNSMHISSSALSVNRQKINVISENLANAETTRTADGTPYKRKMVVISDNKLDLPKRNTFRDVLDRERNETIYEKNEFDIPEKNKKDFTGVEVTDVIESQEDFRLVYNPSHPDADPVTGYVAMPNVDHLTEMADMIVAKRAYEANVTVISNTKSMIMKALEIGK